MKKYIFILTFLPLSLMAQPVVSPSLVYADLLARLDNHPILEAVRQQVIEQKESALAATGLPDPMVMLGINNYPADGKGGFDRFAMTSKSIGFTQQIPNSGIRAANSMAKEHLAAKATLAVVSTRQQLEAALVSALAERQRVEKQQSLLEKDGQLLQQEAAYWQGRLQAGEAALDERSRVQAEIAQWEARKATLQAEASQYEATLRQLVNDTPKIVAPRTLPLPWPNSLEIYPVLMAEKDVLVARANVDGAEAAFAPNYQVGMSYAQRDNSGAFDGGDFVSAQVGVSVPLWSSRNQKPKLRAAEAGVARAHAMAEDTKRQWQQQLVTQAARLEENRLARQALLQKKKALQAQVQTLRAAYTADGMLNKLLGVKRQQVALDMEQARLEAEALRLAATFNSAFKTAEEPYPSATKAPSVPTLSPSITHPLNQGENL